MTTTATRPVDGVTARLRSLWLVAAAVGAAAGIATIVLALDGGLEAAAPGLPDAGPLVRGAIPVLRAAVDVLAAATIGLLVLATFVLAPERGSDPSTLGGVRLRAVRLAAVTATGWLASGVALLVLTYADVAGTRVGSAGFWSQLNFYVREIDLGRSAFVSLVLVMLVATCAGGVTRVFPTGWLTVLALAALFPVALSGHSAASDDHQNAVDSLFVHLVGVSVWVGGLVAVLVLAPVLGRQLASTVRRYSTIAGWAFAAVAVSGVVNAWLRIGGLDGLDSTYGAILVAKVAALIALGVAGWWQRRSVVAQLGANGSGTEVRWPAFTRLAVSEAFVMAGTIGLGVALSRTPPPVPDTGVGEDPVAALLGFPMPSPRTVDLLLRSWYPEAVFLTLAVVMAALYVAAMVRLRRRGDGVAWARAVAWLAGCGVLVWVTSGGPAVYGRVSFSGHMMQHMTLMMLVPILLVIGAPITLALRTLRKRADASAGPREWLLAVLHSRFVRVVSNPIVAAVLFVGSLVAFYYSGLFQLSLATHTGHLLMTVHFLLVGYLFVWVLIGTDPGPSRPPYPMRLLLLLATVSFHAFFGLALINGTAVLAPDWWASLNLTDTAALIDDQQAGGAIAWGVGELPTLLLMVIIGFQWARDDEREARRKDRAADRDGDAELAAWNEQLQRLADRDSPDRP